MVRNVGDAGTAITPTTRGVRVNAGGLSIPSMWILMKRSINLWHIAGICHQRAAKAGVNTFVNAASIRDSVHQGRIFVRKLSQRWPWTVLKFHKNVEFVCLSKRLLCDYLSRTKVEFKLHRCLMVVASSRK